MSSKSKSADGTSVKPADSSGNADTGVMAEDTLTPATEVAASGAMIEPTVVERIDTAHPSVDNEPRKGTSIASNQIDFNTPSALQSLEVTVAEKLGEQNDK